MKVNVIQRKLSHTSVDEPRYLICITLLVCKMGTKIHMVTQELSRLLATVPLGGSVGQDFGFLITIRTALGPGSSNMNE